MLMRSTIEVQLLAERSGQRQTVAKAALIHGASNCDHAQTYRNLHFINESMKQEYTALF